MDPSDLYPLRSGVGSPSELPAAPGSASDLPARVPAGALSGAGTRLRMQPQARGLAAAGERGAGDRMVSIARSPRTWLVLLLIVSLLLRLWGIKQGLPFSYNSDEAQHFVPKAIQFFSGDWNPHYFLNPPGYSYLLTIVFELWFGSADAAVRAYTLDPTTVFVLARVVNAVLGTLSVLLLYGAGVKIFRPAVALLAAAIFGLAFLPIFYSHLALNDVPALFWVCLALYGIGGIWRDGRRRDYLIAGVAVGLAAATKYTDGWVVICLAVAAGYDGVRNGTLRRAVGWTAAALVLALVSFSAANPYWFLSFHSFISGVSQQAADTSGSAEPAKIGTTPGGGILYYLWTFTWGLGLGPAVAAAAGAVLVLLKRRWWLFALLVPGQVTFIIFMGLEQRYFGRWLMPIFPTVALLAAWTACELVGWVTLATPVTRDWLVLHRRVPVFVAALLAAGAMLTQSLVSVVHNDKVLSRPYTTNLARAWMLKNIPTGQNVVIEPVIPGNWVADLGQSLPWTPSGSRWYQYPTLTSRLGPNGQLLPDGEKRYVTLDQYEKTLYPGLIANYEAHAFCWVVSGSLQSGRAFVQPQANREAVAYYKELAKVGKLAYSVSPFLVGTNPVPFGFDWTIDYYPHGYRLPGPEMSIYHLTGGACKS